jgi:hypothetical protein
MPLGWRESKIHQFRTQNARDMPHFLGLKVMGLGQVGRGRTGHSAFSIQHSAFSIQHSAFSIQHSAFSIQHSHCKIAWQVYINLLFFAG